MRRVCCRGPSSAGDKLRPRHEFYAVILELSVRVAPLLHGTVAGRHRDTFTPAGTRCCASPAPANFGTKVRRPSVTGHWPPAACSTGEKISCEDKEPYKVYSGVIFAHHRSSSSGRGPEYLSGVAGPRLSFKLRLSEGSRRFHNHGEGPY